MAREIGISKIHLHPVLTNNNMEATYGAAIPLPWCVNLSTTDNYAEGSYYADNVVERASKLLTAIDVELEVSSNTPPALDAKITGRTITDAMSIKKSGQIAPYYAISMEIAMDDGNIRRRVIYNTNLTRAEQENSTTEDSIDGKTYTYTGTATALLKNGFFEMVLDRAEIDAMPNVEIAEQEAKQRMEDAWTNFFTTPQGVA